VILFVPAYDATTYANLIVARRLEALLPTHSLSYLAEAATREALLSALDQTLLPVFIMTHGRPELLRGQAGTLALGTDPQDLRRLGSRSIYAFACHTANQLGEQAARAGASWWGYTGAIQCPDDAMGLLPIDILCEFLTIYAVSLQKYKLLSSGSWS
jgi:hypothetical protein